MIFRTCPVCGCALDPGERCDFLETGKEAAPAATGTTSAKWTHQKDTSRSAASQGRKGGVGMPNELRSLRVDLGLPAKDMVAVVQELYPKYDKTMQSKCENGDDYGISIRPDAMKALYAKFAPNGTKASRRKKDRHRLTGRITCRLEDTDMEALQQRMKADGHATAQELMTDLVRRYLAGEVEA